MDEHNAIATSSSTTSVNEKTFLLGGKSPGVRRIEAISSQFTKLDRVIIFIGVFLIAYAYGLDGSVRWIVLTWKNLRKTPQLLTPALLETTATASYQNHSLLATINVIRSVIAAAAQPTAARTADVFGRVGLIIVPVVFYVIGTIVEATANSFQTFAGGSVLHHFAALTALLLFIPTLPFLINTWVSGNITSTVLGTSSWQWGIGMWAIIYPVCSLPLIVALGVVGRRARKNGVLDKYKSPYQMLGARGLAVELFWQLDVVGIILLIAVFALILVPFTTAGGVSEQWRTAHVIAPLLVGICWVPAWIIWERRCKHPLVPFHLLKDRAVWGAPGIAVMLNFEWTCQGNYLFTVLIVAFALSIPSATRILSLYSFCSVLVGFGLGAVVYRVRHLRGFIILGTVLFLVASGLLIHYRGSPTSSGQSGVIGAQVVLGFAGGLFPYPAQASIQAATKHEHLAVITGLYLACYNIGSVLGNTVSGAIWTQVLPHQLEMNLNGFGNSTLASATYESPFVVVGSYPVGTDVRAGIINAYQYTQRLLCITGICLCIPLIMFSLCLRDPRLPDEQSRPEAEADASVREGSAN